MVVETPEQVRQVEAGFPAMAEKYKTDEALKNKIWGVRLIPLEEIHLSPQKAYETEVKGNRSSMIALIVAAIAILCIAWINYINLTVVRSMERAREVGIRRVSGATRKQLIAQFLFEALLNNAIAFVLALGILEVVLPAFDRLTGRELDLWVWFRSAWSLLIVFVLRWGYFYPVLSGGDSVRHKADENAERKVRTFPQSRDHPEVLDGCSICRFDGIDNVARWWFLLN